MGHRSGLRNGCIDTDVENIKLGFATVMPAQEAVNKDISLGFAVAVPTLEREKDNKLGFAAAEC